MQASLCLPAKSHHQLAFNLSKLRTIPHCHHQLSQNFSLLFRARLLYVGHRQRQTIPVIQAHHIPPSKDSLNMAKDAVRSAATAAMNLARTMWTSFTARSNDPFTLQLKSILPPPQMSMEPNILLQKSVEALMGAMKCAAGSHKPAVPLNKSLSEVLNELLPDVQADFKKVLDIDGADLRTISLKEALDKWKNIETLNQDKYIEGLVLTDLLIYQGDYKEADKLCSHLESYRTESDVRVPIRRALLKLMLDGTRSKAKESAICKQLKEIHDRAYASNAPSNTSSIPSSPPDTSE